MKITLLRSNLKDGLASVEKALGESNHLPILKNVLLKTIGNKINILTTNLEFAITKTISGKILEDGGLTVPFHTFYTIVNNTNQERIDLERSNTTFIFKTDNYEAKIQGLKEDEFPVIPHIEKNNYFEISAPTFKKAINKIINAAIISEIRPEISGILFDFRVNNLVLVATDSFRLAEKTIDIKYLKTNINHAFKAIIPLKTIQEVVRIFNDDEVIIIYFDSNQVLFKNSTIEILSRLIEGQYPDYQQIIPKNITTTITVNTEHFINAIKLVSTFSGKNNDVNIAVKNNSHLDIYLTNQSLGENNYLIPSSIIGDGFNEITFNWRYLLDGLKTIDSENVVFGVNNSTQPAIIKSTEDNSHFYILMPIKI